MGDDASLRHKTLKIQVILLKGQRLHSELLIRSERVPSSPGFHQNVTKRKTRFIPPRLRRDIRPDREVPQWLVDNVIQVLLKHPSGIYVKTFPEEYAKVIGEKMPPSWDFGWKKRSLMFDEGLKNHCRYNDKRQKVYPLRFEWMDDEEVLLKRLLADKMRIDACALTKREQEVFFVCTHHYVREYLDTWKRGYVQNGKLLENFAEEYASMHGVVFSSKHCGLKKTVQLMDAMPDLLEVRKVQSKKNLRLTRVHPSQTMVAAMMERIRREERVESRARAAQQLLSGEGPPPLDEGEEEESDGDHDTDDVDDADVRKIRNGALGDAGDASESNGGGEFGGRSSGSRSGQYNDDNDDYDEDGEFEDEDNDDDDDDVDAGNDVDADEYD